MPPSWLVSGLVNGSCPFCSASPLCSKRHLLWQPTGLPQYSKSTSIIPIDLNHAKYPKITLILRLHGVHGNSQRVIILMVRRKLIPQNMVKFCMQPKTMPRGLSINSYFEYLFYEVLRPRDLPGALMAITCGINSITDVSFLTYTPRHRQRQLKDIHHTHSCGRASS